MMTAGVIRVVLLIDIMAMALLGLIYLRQRRMNWSAYFCWGMIVLLLPVLGPFLVISNRPGDLHPDPFPSAELRQRVSGCAREIGVILGSYLAELILPFASPSARKELRQRSRYHRRQRW